MPPVTQTPEQMLDLVREAFAFTKKLYPGTVSVGQRDYEVFRAAEKENGRILPSGGAVARRFGGKWSEVEAQAGAGSIFTNKRALEIDIQAALAVSSRFELPFLQPAALRRTLFTTDRKILTTTSNGIVDALWRAPIENFHHPYLSDIAMPLATINTCKEVESTLYPHGRWTEEPDHEELAELLLANDRLLVGDMTGRDVWKDVWPQVQEAVGAAVDQYKGTTLGSYLLRGIAHCASWWGGPYWEEIVLTFFTHSGLNTEDVDDALVLHYLLSDPTSLARDDWEWCLVNGLANDVPFPPRTELYQRLAAEDWTEAPQQA